MGIFTSFATGFLEGSVQVAKEKAAAELEDKKIKAERQDKLGTIIFDLIKDGKLTGDQGAELLGKSDLTRADIAGMVNMVNEAATFEDIGGMKIPLTAEFQYQDPSDKYVNATIFWKSFDKAAENDFDNLYNYYSTNPAALKALKKRVGREVDIATQGWNRDQMQFSKPGDKRTPWNMEQNYASAVRLLDKLNSGVGEQAAMTETAIAQANMPDYNPQTHGILKLRTSEGIMPQAVPLEDIETLNAISSINGFADIDEFLEYTVPKVTDLTEEEREAMTSEQFAWSQNELIKKAIRLERDFGKVLRQNVSLNRDENKALLDRLQEEFGDDRTNQVRGLAYITGGSKKYFKRPEGRNRFSNTVPDTLQAQISVAEFIMEEFKVDREGFQQGVSAQFEAVNMLDRLSRLEIEAASEVGTGAVRGTFKLLGELGVQIQQVPGAFKSLIGANSVSKSDAFTNMKDGTTAETLTSIVNQLKSEGLFSSREGEMNLENLSQIDALRLALAAKMARAVDPSGRLSNQDFEIQLRRLAGGNFATAGQIQANLDLLKEEFRKDLQYKTELSNMLNDTSLFTPVKANQIQASAKLRALRHSQGVYGIQNVNMGTTQQGTRGAEGLPKGLPEGSKPLGDGYFISSDGNTIYDADGNDVTDSYMKENLPVDEGKEA
jgi:hypothetical protein|tara:strand:+ start:598 stop:2589 length:1992 start_codon:yes stop_codon:yes gene_type:complete